jgi:hypothetical protein
MVMPSRRTRKKKKYLLLWVGLAGLESIAYGLGGAKNIKVRERPH